MPVSHNILEENLSPSVPGTEHLCFLAGARISYDLASTHDVIEALLRVLLSLLGERKAAVVAKRLLSQSIGGLKVENPIRFEYLLQLVKDYFQTSFLFLKHLYDTQQPPNSYHVTLAQITQQNEHVVFTTNFDRQIERAVQGSSNTGMPLRPAFRDRDFLDVVAVDTVRGILKLPGSVHDVRTLGATFDTTTLSGHQEKRRALEMGLHQGSLCVIGYSGGDDTNAIPTLLETPAFDHSVYWFLHNPSREPTAYRFDRPNEIPDTLRQTTVYQILERMVNKRMRKAERVVLLVGRTEDTIERFLALRRIAFLHGTGGRPPSLEETQ